MESKESYPTIKDFVLQQAHEKAYERLVMGLKDYEKQKAKILSERKEQLHNEFQKIHKQNMAQRRIHKSSLINESRMTKMMNRHKNISMIVVEAEKTLSNKLCRDETKYRPLLKGLIVEGLIKLLEPVVFVRCLRRDKSLVESLLPECLRDFQNLLAKEGIDQSLGQIDLKIDDRYVLEEVAVAGERVSKSQEDRRCFGGVILTNEDGLIVCKNTLDSRLELAYQQLLPKIRKQLFAW